MNYNHLHYFWVVATTGSIAKAARSLHVTPQTISGQLRTLEARLGSALFQRTAGKLGLSETGRVVHSYVDPMFSLGWELGEVLEKRVPRRPSPLSVGVATGVGKAIAWRMLEPALDVSARVRVLCHEVPREGLVAALARDVDLVVTDAPVPSSDSVRLRSHLIGRCGTTLCSTAALAERYRTGFPASLDGAPFVMPARGSSLARMLADWFRLECVAPSILAEIESPDLASVMCETYAALFAVPTTIAREIERKHGVSAVGDVPSLEQHFYVACAERPARHESILSIIESARARFREPLLASGCDPRASLQRPALDECVI